MDQPLHRLELLPFDDEHLLDALLGDERSEHGRRNAFQDKTQLRYLLDFLQEQRCKSIIVEDPYVDREFLGDFSAFYVRSFEPYPRYCKRVHFFEERFTEGLKHAFDRSTKKRRPGGMTWLQKSYLGSVVIKPLPFTFIGRTSLAHPLRKNPNTLGPCLSHDHVRRNSLDAFSLSREYNLFPTLRRYEAHLAGLDLQVDSLAYQEQDTAAAACASTAIWTSLHKAAKLFDTRIPSPGEITGLAGFDPEVLSRLLPSEGLTGKQVCHAMRATGLEVDVVAFEETLRRRSRSETIKVDGKRRKWKAIHLSYLQDANPRGPIYAYVSYGIPVILGLSLPRSFDEDGLAVDGHAVVVSGFTLASVREKRGPSRVADRMSRLFLHDDRVGPFFPAWFQDGFDPEPSRDPRSGKNLSLEYRSNGGVLSLGVPSSEESDHLAIINAIYAPVDQWIRVGYNHAWKRTFDFANHMSKNENLRPFFERSVWDFRLSDVVELYRDFSSSRKLNANPNLRDYVLRRTMWPKHIWRATAHARGQPQLELIMDCTESPRSFFVKDALVFDANLKQALEDEAQAGFGGQLDPHWSMLLLRTLPRQAP